MLVLLAVPALVEEVEEQLPQEHPEVAAVPPQERAARDIPASTALFVAAEVVVRRDQQAALAAAVAVARVEAPAQREPQTPAGVAEGQAAREAQEAQASSSLLYRGLRDGPLR